MSSPQAPWRCMCDGCGAPLQHADVRCGYCMRATMSPERDVDVMRDALIDGVKAGVISINRARALLGPRPIAERAMEIPLQAVP